MSKKIVLLIMGAVLSITLVGGGVNAYFCNTEDPASCSPVVMPTASPSALTAGKEAIVNATSDDNGALAVTFDNMALRFASAADAICVVASQGTLDIETASPNAAVMITFVVEDNPLIGETTVIANGASTVFNIAASSLVIVPEVENGMTTVSLYKVHAIAGFKMVFHYTGAAPMVTDLAVIGAEGIYSTHVDTANKKLIVVWANPVNVDLNGDLFSVSGVTTLTLTANDAELRYIVDDLSSVRANVGVAANLENAI